MKAIRIHAFGGPDQLKIEDIPVPVPAADEVLIKIYATSVNPIDWKIREGERKEKIPSKLPLTLGWDVSGVIESVGQQVTSFKAGDEVYGRPDPTKNGAYAEYMVVKADQISFKPQTIDYKQAAAVPLAGLTAWQGIFDHGHLEKGQKVLIHAGSGGVGTFAIQFARWKGAEVITTSSAENIAFLRLLGADYVIDYRKEKFEEKISDVDLVFDTIGGDTQKRSLGVLKSGGRLITTVKPEFIEEAKKRNIVLEGFTAQSYPAELKDIAKLIDEGKVKPVIDRIMPLAQAAEAQQISKEGHTRGKIVLNVV
jgi:NADPH:quinone reductase-like Zn-dependent oxidoreductase